MKRAEYSLRDLKTTKVANEMAIGAFLKANNTIISNTGTNYALPPDANCRLMVTLDKNYDGIVKAQFATPEGKFEKHDGVVAIQTLDNNKTLTRDEVFSFVKAKVDELTDKLIRSKAVNMNYVIKEITKQQDRNGDFVIDLTKIKEVVENPDLDLGMTSKELLEKLASAFDSGNRKSNEKMKNTLMELSNIHAIQAAA